MSTDQALSSSFFFLKFSSFSSLWLLLSEGIYTLPGGCGRNDQALSTWWGLSFPFIFLRVKVCSRVPIFLNSIESRGSSSSCKQGGEKLRALINKHNSWCVLQNIKYKKKNLSSSYPPFLPILVSRTFSMVSLSSYLLLLGSFCHFNKVIRVRLKSFWSSL